MNETSVPKAELEKVTQTSPTANMANVLQPMEVKENTPLEDITKHYDNIASNFNAIGENLAKDVDARQNLLIGNDYTNNDGSAIGAYNYQRYYPQPLASGADAISIIGTNKALNTGMKRTQEAAEKRLKAAQDRARRYQQAQAAAAARAAAQQEAIRKQQLSSVKNVNLSTLDLNKLKEKGIEVQDFMRMDPAKRAEALGRATDQASGMADAYNKGWENKSDPNSLWNKTVQEMYRRFGASGATTDDEFSGPAGQSDENKAFWKRADVSKAFGETYAALAGQGTDYYQRRAEYVGQVNNKIQNVLDHGGKLDEVINALNSVEFKFNTNVSPKNFVSYMASDNFKNIVGNMDRLTHALDGGVAVKDPSYLNQIRAIREAAVASEKDKTGEKGFAEELQKKGISGVDAKNAMEKVSSLFNGLSNTMAVQGTSGQVKSFKDFYKGAYNTDLSSIIEGFSKATDPKYEEKKVNGLTLSRDFLAFDADEMLTLYDWKTKNPKELDNIMNHISMAMYNPIQVSDGSLKDANGKVIPKGEVLFYTVPGTENLAVTKDLKTELANNISIDENGSPHYTNKEAIDKAYNNYIQSAAIVDSYLNDGKYTDSTDVANIIQYSIANRNGFAIGDYNPYENPEERSAAKELTIKGKKIKDVISDFNKLLDSQREDVALAINELAKGGSNKYSLHGVLDGELTKEDAEALSLLINLNSKSNKSIAGEGSMEGFHDSVLNIAQGAGESFTTSLEGSINFLGSLAKMSMAVMNPVSLLNGTNNMFTEGLDYIVNGSKSGHKIVDFAQGIRDREEDRADLVNNPRLAQAGIEHTVKDGFRGGGHIAGGIGEFIAESIVTAGIGKLLTTGAKGVTTLGAKTLGSLMAKNSTDDILAKGIKEVVESTSDDVIRNSLDDVISKGAAKGASLGDEVTDASTKMFNKAAKGADDVARSAGDDVAKSSVEKGAEAKNVLDDALHTARKEAIGNLNAKSSVEDIESALSKGLSKFKDDVKSLVEPFLKETSIKAKMYALGLSDDIVKNVNKVGMSAFKSISKHMGDDIAKDFAEKAAAFTAKTGKDLTVRDAMRMIGGLEGQGAKAVQLSMRLKDEMRQTLAGMAHSIRSNDQGLQQISPVDDKGNLNLEKPITFLINEGILDLGMGMGMSYVGDIFRMQRLKAQRGYYEGRLDKANKALEYLNPRSEDYTKQMEKIYNLNTKLTNTELELGLEYQMHGNSVKYQELVQTAQKNSDELIKTVSKPWYEEWDSKNGEKTPSIDDMMEILKNKAGAKETSYDFRVAAKMASMFQHRKFTSEMPTLNSMLNGKEWVDVVVEHNNRMAKYYSEGNIKSSWKQNNKMLGDILLEKGYPKAEVETYINYRNGMDMRASTVLKDQMRRSYYSVASIKNTDLDVPLEYKGNSLAGSAGVPFFTKHRANVDQVKLFESLQKYYNNGKKIGDGIVAGKEVWNGFDERALNPIADLMYINNQWRSREMMHQAREAQFSRGDIIGVIDPDFKSPFPVNKKEPSKAELFKNAFNSGKKSTEELAADLRPLGFDQTDIDLVKDLRSKIDDYVKFKGFDANTELRFKERFFSDLVSGNGSPIVYKTLLSAAGSVERANEILGKYSSKLHDLDDAFMFYRRNLKEAVLKDNPWIKQANNPEFNRYMDELSVASWYYDTNYVPTKMKDVVEKVKKNGVTNYSEDIVESYLENNASKKRTIVKMKPQNIRDRVTHMTKYPARAEKILENTLKDIGYDSTKVGEAPVFKDIVTKDNNLTQIKAYESQRDNWIIKAIDDLSKRKGGVENLKKELIENLKTQDRFKYDDGSAVNTITTALMDKYTSKGNYNLDNLTTAIRHTDGFNILSPEELAKPSSKLRGDKITKYDVNALESRLNRKLGYAPGSFLKETRKTGDNPLAHLLKYADDYTTINDHTVNGKPYSTVTDVKFSWDNIAKKIESGELPGLTPYEFASIFGKNSLAKDGKYKDMIQVLTEPATLKHKEKVVGHNNIVGGVNVNGLHSLDGLTYGVNNLMSIKNRKNTLSSIKDIKTPYESWGGNKVSKFLDKDSLVKIIGNEGVVDNILNTKVYIKDSSDKVFKNSNATARYYKNRDTIYIRKGIDQETAVNALRHELSHVIDAKAFKGLYNDSIKNPGMFYLGHNTERIAQNIFGDYATGKALDLNNNDDLDLKLLDLLDSSVSAGKPIDDRIHDLKTISDAFSEDTVHVANNRTTVNLKYADDYFKSKFTSLSDLIYSAEMDASKDKKSIMEAYRSQFMSAHPGVKPHDLYVDNELADIIKASLEAKPGSEQAKFSKAFDKFVDISKNIQQMQLAAGYGVFNAYSGLQIRDVFMSTVTRNPIQAIKILGTYLDARNLDSAQKFFADPNRSAILLKYTALTGDTKFIDAMSEINSYGPGETNAINRLISGWKDTISQSKANGQKGYGKATGKLLNTLTEDATFMRLIPILQVKHLEFEVNAQTKSWLRKNPGVDLTEDIRNELIKRAGDSVEAFWNPHVGIGKKGNTHLDIKKNEMVYGKNRTKKDSIMDVVDTFVFARLHQQTMVGRVLNGIFSMVNPKRWGDNRYNSARGYAASFLGLVVLAQAWNHITDPHKQDNSSASGFDPNDIVGTLTNLGSVAAFNIPGKSAKLDSMFSTFTMPNRLMRTGVAIANQFKKIEDRDPRVNDIAHEAGSFLLSPYSTAMDIAMGNKYGYSVWGKNAAAIDPDTGEPVDYDPGKDWIAIMSYALGISDRNGRGENISGGGILKHPYIDAINDLNKYHDPLTSILMGLEVPIKRVNNLGYAKAEFNGNVHDSIRSFYKEYKNASEGASNARKNELYQEFAKKAVERIALWNSRHKVLKDNPQELLAAQRMLMAYLSDEVSEHDKKIMNAYWASGIDKLGGFDKRADETDDQYKERKKITGQAWDLQMAKESKARKTLRELGFDPIGFEYKDIEANRKETKRNLLSQFKAYTEGKTGGGEDLKAVKAQYQDEIAARRNAKDFNGAAQLEKEYINKLDGVLAPYIEKYGKYMLIQNPDFMDIVKPLVMIPQSDSKKYLSDNRARNWLLDRYGIGYRDGSHLIADDKYVSAYNKVLKDLVSGKSSSAGDRVNRIIDGVGSGKFQPSKKQYEQLMKIYNNINRR